jgi:RNA polymerase sigma-70 factor (ECF subfamily)
MSRVAEGDQEAFALLMQRHNPRLFRIARAILRDDAEAEEALQDAYLDAYRHAAGFRGDSQVITWLTRIVVNRSLMRLRRKRTDSVLVPFRHADDERGIDDVADPADPPYASLLRAEMRALLERRIDALPMTFRAVFVMREVEDMTGQEVADALSLPLATVRTRLFRARALLRAALQRDVDTAAGDVFGFAGARCDRIVAGVLARITEPARH